MDPSKSVMNARQYDKAGEVLTSVKLALKIGRRNNSTQSQVSVRTSDFYLPKAEDGLLTRHYQE